MRARIPLFFLWAAVSPVQWAASAPPAEAQENTVTLTVPDALADAGLWKHILPRFTLKTRVQVTLAPEGTLRLLPGETGPDALAAGDVVLALSAPQDPAAERFADWLVSDVGRNTIDSYAEAAGEPDFAAPDPTAGARREIVYSGDAVSGETLSLALCGRCHVVNETNRMSGLGSTPSFGLLRSFPDWASRFEGFFALNPHGAFTQIDGVTPPFPIDRPSPISPVEMTLDDLDAILAYVQQVIPADLGAPIQHQ